MGLFDETAARNTVATGSEEISNAFTTVDILAACTSLQTLLESANSSEAKSLIVIGTTEPPLNGEAFTVGELENRIAWCQLYPKLDEASYLVSRNVGGVSPKKEGYFRLHIRRQVRRSEYEAIDGRNDVWRYFWWKTSLLAEQFVKATDEVTQNAGLVEKQMRRDGGPAFNLEHQANWPDDGYFLFANFLIPWGGIEGGE